MRIVGLTDLEAMRVSTPCHRGIYFLWKDSRIIYIGQSVNMASRIFAHLHMQYDSHTLVQYPTENLNDLEAEYIIRHKPINNKGLPENKLWKSAALIKREAGFTSVTQIKKFARLTGVRVEQLSGILYYSIPDLTSALAAHAKTSNALELRFA